MATKPTVRIPLWASTGSKTDPGAGQEADGWDPGDRPPANWINWIYNALGQWAEYFEDQTDEHEVDIAARMIKANPIAEATLLFDSSLAALIDFNPRLQDSIAMTDARRHWLINAGTSGNVVHIYSTDIGFEFVYNAHWQEGTGWVSEGTAPGLIALICKDVSGLGNGPCIEFQTTLVANAFTRTLTFNGERDNPPTTGANTIYAGALPRVAASVQVLSSTVGAVSAKSLGVLSVQANTETITVIFTNTFANADYFVSATLQQSDQDRSITIVSKAAGSCVLKVWDATVPDGVVNPTTSNIYFDFVAIGLQ